MSKKHLSMISELLEKCDRLTRELAEAKARAGSAAASLPDGWVPVPVEPTGGMVESGFFALLEAETDDNGALMFSVAEVIYRAMISARPKSPPNGLPSKESGNAV